jgi:acetyl-CoA carboxylase biotin carboxyl carrier protein
MTRKANEADRDIPRPDRDERPIVDLDFLRGLLAAVDESGIDSLEVARGGTRIRLSKTPPAGRGGAAGPTQQMSAPAHTTVHEVSPPPAAAPALAPAPQPAANNWVDVKSPMVGTFYRAPAPEAPSYVEVGSRVAKGQTLCILEAMKLMNELESEVSGVVREICVENSEPVEYGQVLFRVEPEA